MNGSLIYKIEDGQRLMSLNLTICDENELKHKGLSEIRRNRLIRLLLEAKEQGCLLSYKDLKLILLSSLATLKRDVNYLRGQGMEIPIKNGK
ncbi:MAG: DUF1670 domain-containing protein [Nitrospirae bacterium]|nr:DUF1670 domain-containing protein [Nitrospirota bacterium]